jgi:hypothetical protein
MQRIDRRCTHRQPWPISSCAGRVAPRFLAPADSTEGNDMYISGGILLLIIIIILLILIF